MLYYLLSLQKGKEESSLKTEQNVNLSNRRAKRQTNGIIYRNKFFFGEFDPGGMPKTCKSNEMALRSGVLAQSGKG